MAHLPNHRRIITAAVLTALVPLVAAGSASSAASTGAATAAAPAPPPVVELLARGTVAKPFEAHVRGIELETERPIDVVNVHITWEPGSMVNWHTHPGPTVVTVTAGTLTVRQRDCSRHTYTVGETFVEPGPKRHLARNAGDTTAETIVTFFVPVGADPLTIPATAPACAG